MRFLKMCLGLCLVGVCAGLNGAEEKLDTRRFIPDWLMERARTMVYVRLVIHWEMDRQQVEGSGLVLDDEGLVVILPGFVPDWIPPNQFKDIKVHPAFSTGDGYDAEYLGQDMLNTWHYLRISEEAREKVTGIRNYPVGSIMVGETLWGIGMTNESLDYLAYYNESRVAGVQALPSLTGFMTGAVAAPGGAVFNTSGAFVGWSGVAYPEDKEIWVNGEYMRISMRTTNESSLVLLAEEFLDEAGKRVPSSPAGDPRPWIGISGMQSVDKDTAEFLGLSNQGAIVISEVLKDSPADAGGLRDRDIVVGLRGEPLPRLMPDSVVQTWFEREILLTGIGGELQLQVIRGENREDLTITVGTAPKLMREAERIFLDELGFSVREIVLADAMMRRVPLDEARGAVVNFVRPNSPPQTAGLQNGDWIEELDGTRIENYADLVDRLQSLQSDSVRAEYVMLISRPGETSVLRVKRR